MEKNKEDGWITVKVDGIVYEGVLEIKSTKSGQFGEDGRKQLLDWIDRGRTLRLKNYKGYSLGIAFHHGRHFRHQSNSSEAHRTG